MLGVVGGGPVFTDGNEVLVAVVGFDEGLVADVAVEDGLSDVLGLSADVVGLVVADVVELEDADLLLLDPHPAAARESTTTTQVIAARRPVWGQVRATIDRNAGITAKDRAATLG